MVVVVAILLVRPIKTFQASFFYHIKKIKSKVFGFFFLQYIETWVVLNEVLLEKVYLLSNEYPQDIGLFDWSFGFSSDHLDWE